MDIVYKSPTSEVVFENIEKLPPSEHVHIIGAYADRIVVKTEITYVREISVSESLATDNFDDIKSLIIHIKD